MNKKEILVKLEYIDYDLPIVYEERKFYLSFQFYDGCP